MSKRLKYQQVSYCSRFHKDGRISRYTKVKWFTQPDRKIWVLCRYCNGPVEMHFNLFDSYCLLCGEPNWTWTIKELRVPAKKLRKIR